MSGGFGDTFESACAREIANDVWAFIEAHEATCTDEACMARINILAYIAHVIGVRVSHLEVLSELMEGYEAGCAMCQAGTH